MKKLYIVVRNIHIHIHTHMHMYIHKHTQTHPQMIFFFFHFVYTFFNFSFFGGEGVVYTYTHAHTKFFILGGRCMCVLAWKKRNPNDLFHFKHSVSFCNKNQENEGLDSHMEEARNLTLPTRHFLGLKPKFCFTSKVPKWYLAPSVKSYCTLIVSENLLLCQLLYHAFIIAWRLSDREQWGGGRGCIHFLHEWFFRDSNRYCRHLSTT